MLILASQSPRRQQLLTQAGYDFEIRIPDVDETAPEGMAVEKVAEFLARKKADAIPVLAGNTIVAADTIVLLDGEMLGKPTDAVEAVRMLRRLSGKTHTVATGVCIRNVEKVESFTVLSEVTFREISQEQIVHYVSTQPPLDKAGSYAIHEWIGLIAIERINGDYYSVMGLPIGEVVKILSRDFGVALALQTGNLCSA